MNQSIMLLVHINSKHNAPVGNRGQKSSKSGASTEYYAELLSALGDRRKGAAEGGGELILRANASF